MNTWTLDRPQSFKYKKKNVNSWKNQGFFKDPLEKPITFLNKYNAFKRSRDMWRSLNRNALQHHLLQKHIYYVLFLLLSAPLLFRYSLLNTTQFNIVKID